MGCGVSSDVSQIEAIRTRRRSGAAGYSYLASDPDSLDQYKATMAQIGAQSDSDDDCETVDGVLREAKKISLAKSCDTLSGRSAIRSGSSSDRSIGRLAVSFRVTSVTDRFLDGRSMSLSISDCLPGSLDEGSSDDIVA